MQKLACSTVSIWASLVAHWLRICLPVQEAPVWSLGGVDPLEKKTATHSRILAWEMLWTEEPKELVQEVAKGLDTA